MKPKPIRILIIDDQFAQKGVGRNSLIDNTGIIEAGAKQPASSGIEAVFCSGQRKEGNRLINDYAIVHDAVADGNWALVLLDVQFDSGELDSTGKLSGQDGDALFGMVIRHRLTEEFPSLPVVMLTSKRQAEINEDGTPYLSKYKLGSYELRRALLHFGRLDAEASRVLLDLGDEIRSDDPVNFAVFRQAFTYAGADASILILGESGVGKEVLARYVHRMSSRREGAWIAVNVAAIPSELIESELFGIGKKIATGVDARQGKFELASGGTLFLDEIGDMPLEMQAKVLRALQERKIVRIGESREIAVDIRLVCATSRNLADLVQSGKFRGDLLYRINTVPITIAPLRERRGDIAPLARSYLRKFAAQQEKSGLSFSSAALALLEAQPYPGNVRELGNLVEQLVSQSGHHQVISRREVLEAVGMNSSFMLVAEPVSAAQAPHSTVQDTTKPTVPSPSQPVVQPAVTLANLHEILAALSVEPNDPALRGAKPRLEKALKALVRRCAGAVLELYIDPMKREYRRQPAMQFLNDNENLKGKGPERVLNEILERKQTTPLSEEDLKRLTQL